MLNITLKSLGIERVNDELTVRANSKNFNQKKHSLLQAMIAINDLFYLARPAVASFFLEDVLAWLDQREISYVPRLKFTGKSGYDHYFDFAIPRTKENPERIAKAINTPNKSNAESFIFSWIDTRENRPENSKALAILNDENGKAMTEVEEALTSYDVHPIFWSARDESISYFR